MEDFKDSKACLSLSSLDLCNSKAFPKPEGLGLPKTAFISID
jgi:hypothetical protein